MHTTKLLIYLTLLSVLLIACHSQKEEQAEETVGFQIEKSEIPGVQRMQSYRSELPVQLKGKDYSVLIVRQSTDSLPQVKGNNGTTYLDNKVVLTVKGSNGQRIINKVFTKQSFASVIEQSFLSKAILEGFVFDKTSSSGFVFAASVSYPQTDLYIPIAVTISPDGKVSMKKEELLEELYVED